MASYIELATLSSNLSVMAYTSDPSPTLHLSHLLRPCAYGGKVSWGPDAYARLGFSSLLPWKWVVSHRAAAWRTQALGPEASLLDGDTRLPARPRRRPAAKHDEELALGASFTMHSCRTFPATAALMSFRVAEGAAACRATGATPTPSHMQKDPRSSLAALMSCYWYI